MKNIIFDVDGTLWDTTEVVAGAWNQSVQDIGGTKAVITAEILKKEFGKPMDIIADNVFYDADQQTKEKLLQKCCEYEHTAVVQYERDMMFPNVRETLIQLSKSCKLFIVSNCQSGYIELFMEKAGVKEYIMDHECFGDTGKSKGENIRLLMDRNHLEEAVYVGDTQGDYESTRYAGIPFVFAKYGFGDPEGFEYSIASFDELCKLSEEI